MRILIVCTGNICRSPVAERVLAHRLAAAGFPADVSSAGTNAIVGADMTPEASALLSHVGAARTPHRARQLTPTLIAEADLVLTATRAHRAAVVQELPRATRRTFTLREFARLAEAARASGELDGLDPAGRVERIAGFRGIAPPPVDPNADDIVDPYLRGPEVYAEAGRLIDEAVEQVVAAVAP